MLDAYFDRIGYRGPRAPTLAVLAAVHEAHALAIPFENLDIQLGKRIRLDLDSLVDKLVRRRRGGYCFEQNSLFAAVLEALGFTVTRLAARVFTGAPQPTPRTHMLLDVDGHLADVGFGADGLYRPIPLRAGEHGEYRLMMDGARTILSIRRADGWRDLYHFTREPQAAIDYELANWYTSTHPDSKFVQTLTAQRLEPGRRWRLRDRDLIMIEAGVESRRVIESPEELIEVLGVRFGLEFPAGTRFARPVFATPG